jgi:hypothetical protein
MGAAFEVPRQRMHARGGEQHLVTVRRHQRAARYHLVAPLGEELKKCLDRFGDKHAGDQDGEPGHVSKRAASAVPPAKGFPGVQVFPGLRVAMMEHMAVIESWSA